MYNLKPIKHSILLQRSLPIGFLLTALMVPTISTLSAAENSELSQLDETVANSRFEYILENRLDPFVPFLTEKAATSNVDMNEVVEKNEILTGMQLFEPGQLTLVALMQSGNEDIAMVEDFTGKGYVLTEGTKIGRKGVVKDIASNIVRIEETAETRAGKKIITEIVMILKKEGEE
ncbi:MAG: Tfp pilus assembly protein PilP [Desulforhopalus sp.]|jgi:Tfp pilus assembly protein PilP